jgi:perosamine synthetase
LNIPLSEPFISGNEWQYIKDCLDKGWVSSVGSYVDDFEKIVANFVGSNYAVATVNGTSALHVSLIACDVQPDDEVVVPTLTFIAPVNVVRYCNAFPIFIDCVRDTLCIDVEKIIDFLNKECEFKKNNYTYNKTTNRRIKAIIPVHVFGHPVDMDSLIKICKKKNIDIIEDATESIGSEYKGKKTGSFGKIGCFSFNGNKIITTGGGGMITTKDENVAKRIRHLTTQAKCDPIEYDHDEIGYNYRLTNIQSALGIAQMEKLDDFIQIKRRNAQLYDELLSGIKEVVFSKEQPWAKSNFWFYTIKVQKKDKNLLLQYLLKKNIQVRPIWKLIHTLPMYTKYQTYCIEKATEAYESCINLPCSVNLKEEEIDYIVDNIKNYLSKH